MSTETTTAQVRLNRVTPSHCRVVLDNPPLNLMGPEFVPQIRDIVTELENDDRVKVVVFESAVDGVLPESLRLPRGLRRSDQHPARSDRPRGMARRPGAPDARPVRLDRADPRAGDRKRQRARARLRHELREPGKGAPLAVRSGRGPRRRRRAHGATAAGHGTGTRPRSAPRAQTTSAAPMPSASAT